MYYHITKRDLNFLTRRGGVKKHECKYWTHWFTSIKVKGMKKLSEVYTCVLGNKARL